MTFRPQIGLWAAVLYAVLFHSTSIFAATSTPPPTTQEAQPPLVEMSPSSSSMGSADHLPWLLKLGLGGGTADDSSGGERFAVTPIETDSLAQDEQHHRVHYMLGGQYEIPIEEQAGLSGLAIGPVVYYTPTEFSGEVYQFQAPKLNNYQYTLNAKPILVYAEANLLFNPFAHTHLRPYALLGAGATFAKLSYRETAAHGIPASSALNTGSHWDEAFAFEAGAGLLVTITDRWFLAGQYVYQHAGSLAIRGNGLLSPLHLRLNTHSGYAILGCRL